MQIFPEKHANLAIVTAVVLIGIFFIIVNKRNPEESDEVSAHEPEIAQSLTQEPTPTAPISSAEADNVTSVAQVATSAANDYRENPRAVSELSQAAKNIIKMQELMDDEESHPKALEMALKLIKSGSDEERAVALDAFQWIGGKESMQALIDVVDEQTEIGERADDIMMHLLQENLFAGKPIMEKDMWLDLFDASVKSNDLLSYMVILAAYPIPEAAPILLEAMKSDKPAIAEQAKNMLESMASGREFESQEAAAKWFAPYFEDTTTEEPQNQPQEQPED